MESFRSQAYSSVASMSNRTRGCSLSKSYRFKLTDLQNTRRMNVLTTLQSEGAAAGFWQSNLFIDDDCAHHNFTIIPCHPAWLKFRSILLQCQVSQISIYMLHVSVQGQPKVNCYLLHEFGDESSLPYKPCGVALYRRLEQSIVRFSHFRASTMLQLAFFRLTAPSKSV